MVLMCETCGAAVDSFEEWFGGICPQGYQGHEIANWLELPYEISVHPSKESPRTPDESSEYQEPSPPVGTPGSEGEPGNIVGGSASASQPRLLD